MSKKHGEIHGLDLPWKNEDLAQTYFYAKTCSARLGLDLTRLGIKGSATFATLSSFFCMFISTRPSIYILKVFFLIRLR